MACLHSCRRQSAGGSLIEVLVSVLVLSIGLLGASALQVAQWIDSVQAQIHPGACGRITCAGRDCSVGIRWDDSRATGGSDTQAFEIRSRL